MATLKAHISFNGKAEGTPAEFNVNEPIILRFEVSNLTEHVQPVLLWYTPLEGVKSNCLVITKLLSTEKVEYVGIMAKRSGEAPSSAYIELQIGGGIYAEMDLNVHYKLTPGLYQVRPLYRNGVEQNELDFEIKSPLDEA